MDERESRAGHFVFAGRAQAAGDALRQCRLPRPQVSRKQHQDGRLQLRADFAAALDSFFGRVRDKLAASHGRTRNRTAR